MNRRTRTRALSGCGARTPSSLAIPVAIAATALASDADEASCCAVAAAVRSGVKDWPKRGGFSRDEGSIFTDSPLHEAFQAVSLKTQRLRRTHFFRAPRDSFMACSAHLSF